MENTVRYMPKQCGWCSKPPTLMVLDATEYERWQAGEFVQVAFPTMSADLREVLISGTHPQCWDKMLSDWDEDE